MKNKQEIEKQEGMLVVYREYIFKKRVEIASAEVRVQAIKDEIQRLKAEQ